MGGDSVLEVHRYFPVGIPIDCHPGVGERCPWVLARSLNSIYTTSTTTSTTLWGPPPWQKWGRWDVPTLAPFLPAATRRRLPRLQVFQGLGPVACCGFSLVASPKVRLLSPTGCCVHPDVCGRVRLLITQLRSPPSLAISVKIVSVHSSQTCILSDRHYRPARLTAPGVQGFLAFCSRTSQYSLGPLAKQ
eukprot:2184435-Rhodomonas_salina.2